MKEYICCKCKKEIVPVISVDENGINSILSYASLKGGVGNKELGKCCDECYEEFKIEWAKEKVKLEAKMFRR